jgi:hypothetical protein
MIFWVNLKDGIPASSSVTIYMGVGRMETNYYIIYSGTVGEAPQLSPTYGQYDDGANVFNYYTNFAGTTLPSGWYIGGNNGNVTINNGAKIIGGTSASFAFIGLFFSGLPSSPPFAVDYAPQQTTSPSGASYADSFVGLVNSTTRYATNPGNEYVILTFGGGENGGPGSTFGGSRTAGTLPTPSGNTFVGAFTQLISSSSYYTYYNYTQSTGYITGMSFSSTAGLYWTFEQLGQEGNYAPNGQTIYWFRVRAYPPNGVMPNNIFWPPSASSLPPMLLGLLSLVYQETHDFVMANIIPLALVTVTIILFLPIFTRSRMGMLLRRNWGIPFILDSIGILAAAAFVYSGQLYGIAGRLSAYAILCMVLAIVLQLVGSILTGSTSAASNSG